MFDKSPVMSTYLLAFVIGEFDVIEGRTSDGNFCSSPAPKLGVLVFFLSLPRVCVRMHVYVCVCVCVCM